MSGVGAYQCRKCKQHVFYIENEMNLLLRDAQLCGNCVPRPSYTDVLWHVAELINVSTICACENGHCMGLESCVCRLRIAERIASVVIAGVSSHDEQSTN